MEEEVALLLKIRPKIKDKPEVKAVPNTKIVLPVEARPKTWPIPAGALDTDELEPEELPEFELELEPESDDPPFPPDDLQLKSEFFAM